MGRLPNEDEEFVFEEMKIVPKQITDGKPVTVTVQLVSEEEADGALKSDEKGEVSV